MTQSSLSPSPKLRFFGTNGRPLSGGFLITYDYVTSLPVATWNDAEMTTRNPAQLKLDSNGEPSNNGVPVCVFLEDGRRYKYRWFDSEGTPVGSAGPIQTATITYGSDTTFNYYANVEGTIDEIVVDVSTDQATGVRTYFVKLATAVKNTIATLVENVSALFTNLSNEVTRATNAESALNTAIGNEVTRATNAEGALSNAITAEENRAKAAEYAAKTVVKAGANIEVTKTTAQDGHDEYTVNGVESVPRVNIVSTGNTISVSSSENQQTNTKTFDINVREKPLSLAWVESGNMTLYDDTFFAETYSLLNVSGRQNPQGDKITYDPNTSKLWLAKGYYTILARLTVSWEGTPQNKIIYVGTEPFDLSYNHTQNAYISTLRQFNATTALTIGATVSETPPQGFNIKVKRADIYSIQQVMENVVQGLTEVHHDETLSGTGTEDDPLSVEGGGTEYSAGNGIDITDDTISVKNGKGIFIDSNGHVTTDEPSENFIDITNEWIFVNSYRLKYNGVSPGSGNDMRILYSESSGIVKFTGEMRINTDNAVNIGNWNIFLRYTGSRFYTNKTARGQSDYPQIGYTPEIGGSINIPLSNNNGFSLKSVGKLAYIGSPDGLEQDTGLAFNPSITVSGENIGGCICTNLVIRVTKREN